MSERSSAYITRAGADALEAELKELWKVKRPEVTRRVAEAAAQGDRSENAEYIYGKKQLREIDRRLRYLSRRLDDIVVVDRLPEQREKVFFGAWIRLAGPAGREVVWRIVGPDEIDPKRGWISIDAPTARSLISRQVGDVIEVPHSHEDGESSGDWTIRVIGYEGPV